MYVSMYACMYVRMYELNRCMYVCMYVCILSVCASMRACVLYALVCVCALRDCVRGYVHRSACAYVYTCVAVSSRLKSVNAETG